ncbi:MAG: ribosome maturation factor RimM, partial [Wenzhouxiangella sp.]|nr:ribosome maturation factor RimM [Wenzhouxiangella sp.]
DPPEALFDYTPWFLGGSETPVKVENWRRSGQKLVAQLSDIDSPEAAAKLAETPILVQRTQLPEPAPGQYYWHDLVELDVFNLQEHHWGRVVGLLPTGAHDVLKVASEDGATVLIPFVFDHFVKQVDLQSGRILVDWPEDWVQ